MKHIGWFRNWPPIDPPKGGFNLLEEGIELSNQLLAELISIGIRMDGCFAARDYTGQRPIMNLKVIPCPFSKALVFYDLFIEGVDCSKKRLFKRRQIKPILRSKLGQVLDVLGKFIEREKGSGW